MGKNKASYCLDRVQIQLACSKVGIVILFAIPSFRDLAMSTAFIKQLERSSSAKTGESGRHDERELDTYDHAN